MKEKLYICKYGCEGTIPGICNFTPCIHSVPHEHTVHCSPNYYCAFPGIIATIRDHCRKPKCQEYEKFSIPDEVFEI